MERTIKLDMRLRCDGAAVCGAAVPHNTDRIAVRLDAVALDDVLDQILDHRVGISESKLREAIERAFHWKITEATDG